MTSAIFAEVTAELLTRGHSARFRAPGCSMGPAILDGEAITVEPVRPPEVRMDDIVLYRAERGVIAHRVVGIDRQSKAAPVFTLRGDAAGSSEERVESRQILGRVSAVERKGWGARLLHTARLVFFRRGTVIEMLRRFAPGMMVLCLLAVLGAATPANAATIQSSVTGNWATGSTWVGGVAPVAGDTVVINSGDTVSTAGSRTIAGITMNGGTLTLANGNTVTVNGSVQGASGTISTLTSGGCNIVLMGDWSYTGTIGGNRLSINMNGAVNQTMSGTVGFRNVSIAKTSGTTLFLLAIPTTSNSTWTVFSGNVAYSAAGAQTVRSPTGPTAGAYPEGLILAGSGVKTISGIRVNGVLSMEGTATASAAPTYGSAATLQYNTATARTTGVEWITPFTATGGVKIINSAVITMAASKTVTAGITVDTGTLDQNACSTTHTLTVGRMVLTNGGNYINCNSAGSGGTSGSTLTFNGTTLPELSVGTGSTFDYVGAGTITFAGQGTTANVSNSGIVRINGGGRSSGTATCGDAAVGITVSNSTNNTWATGSGHFELADVALTRQVSSGGTPLLYGSSTKDTYSTGWGAVTGCSNAPTAVSFHSFSAAPQDGGVLLKWRSGQEVDNLGFHVYRDGALLTPSPIAGSALLAGAGTVLTAGNSYSWFDAEGTSSSSYTIEDLDLNGIKAVRGPFYVDAAVAATSSVRRAAGGSPMRAGAAGAQAGSRMVSQLGRAGSGDSRWFTTSVLDVESAAAQATNPPTSRQYALAAGQAVKIGVRQEGWYHVDASQLTAAGMPAFVNPHTLQLFVNGKEQEILVPGEQSGHADGIEFYGTGVDTTWSDTQVYWLTWGSQVGQRIDSERGRARETAPANFPFTVRWKPRMLCFPALINGDAYNFFGPMVSDGAPVTQTLPVTNLSGGTPGNSTLQVRMQGMTAGTHMVGVQLNGNSLGDVVFQDRESGVSSFVVPNAWLAAGAALTLTAQGGGNDRTLVDTVALTYPHTYAADGDALRSTAPSGLQVTITGFSDNQIRVMDVTDPANVSAPEGTVAPLPGGGYSIAVVPQGGGTRTLLAFTNAQMSLPASVEANQPSKWNSEQAGADMVIISHGDFIPSLAPLVKQRQSQGLRVAVVNVEDLYDEFNYGVLSPYAVKDFLANARTEWRREPRWVLLVGDATLDPRDYFGMHQEDYVPVELVGTSQNETASDDWFVDFNDDGISEMAIGRLPVHAVGDAAALVAKIVAYDDAGAAPWKSKALLVAGTNDSDNNFESHIAAVQALLPPGMTVTKILQGSDPDPAANFLAAFNGGQGLVNFSGHGSTEIWKGDLFTSAAASTVTNGAATPFVISMTCLNGYFQDVWTFSLAEAVLQAPGGGAVGVWASSGLTESPAQATLNQAMITALYGGGSITVGEAAVAAKKAVSDPDVQKTWILFGDPAMRVR